MRGMTLLLPATQTNRGRMCVPTGKADAYTQSPNM